MTNSEFAKTDKGFLDACRGVALINEYKDFKLSTRQASKYRRRKGVVWKVANNKLK